MSTLQRERTDGVSIGTKRRPARWPLVVCLCIIVALTVTLTTLSVQFVMSNKEYQQAATSQAEKLESLEAQLGQLQSQQQADASKIEDQENTISDQQDTIRDQQSQLELQNKTISDLKTQISIKRSQQAAQSGLLAGLATTTPYTGELLGQKLVALTFDDGPGPYTARLLDAMKARGVRATFFVVGTRVPTYSALIKRMDDEGHVVANHSQNHKNLRNLSAEGVRTEMEQCAVRIEEIIGHKPLLMRCPGGNYNNTVKEYAQSVGIPIIQWDVDTRDWESRNVNSILSTAFGGNYRIRDGSIVLMHDIYSTTVDAAIQMMDRLASEGYTFVTIPELLTVRYGGIQPGKVYSSAYL